MLAQEAALKEVANIRIRSPLANRKTFESTDVMIGDSALFYKASNRKSLPKWRGSACILDIGAIGVTARHHSQTFKVARYCVRKRVLCASTGDVVGPPSLRISGDRRCTSVLEPACERSSSGWTPKATGGPAVQESEAAMERERASESVPRYTS